MWPGESNEAHPGVFTTVPKNQPTGWKPGQLTQQQLHEFFEDGYVVIPDYFSLDDLEPVTKEIAEEVDKTAQRLLKAGKIRNVYSDLDVFHRLTKLNDEFPGANILLMQIGALTPSMRRLFASPKLLNAMEQILGTQDIVGNPVWHIRSKIPNNSDTVVPWNQTSAYFDNTTYSMMMPTAWIPLLDATEENGCCQFLPRGHRTGRVIPHQCCWKDTWYIMMDESCVEDVTGVSMKDAVTVPVPYRGLLLFNNLSPHCSLPNTSDEIRWSFESRYQKVSDAVGFYGLKDAIAMRSSTDPSLKINWEPFDAVDMHAEKMKYFENDGREEFDLTMSGPWMEKWELVNINKHVQAMLNKKQKEKAVK